MSSSAVEAKMEEPGQPDNKNTLKKTKFDLRIVQAFLQRAGEERDLLAIPVEELDERLANFIRTHRKQDGSEYEAGTLRGILGSMDRHFEKSGYPHAIYRSRETKFVKTVAAMKEKQSYLRTMSGAKAGHPAGGHAEPLTEREIELLYATGAIGLHNPTALLYMLYFNIGLHFSLRTMEQHTLKWGDITLKADARGRKYLEHTKKLSAGRGKCQASHTMRMQIYESPEQPERDVVKAYEKYTVERPEKMKCEDAPFYLTPQPDCRPGYARWFKNLPMGESRIRGIMKHLKMAAGLSPQRKHGRRAPLRSPAVMGSNMAAVLSAQVKASVNGYPNNGLAIKQEDEDYSQDHLLGAESGFTIIEGDGALPSSFMGSPRLRRIKEEWEPEETLHHGGYLGQRRYYPGQGSVTFHDVAACFSAEEWSTLQDWQKELYQNVMREIHSALEAMGYKIVNEDVLLKIKDEEFVNKSPTDKKKDPATASDQSIVPDILLRIKKDEVPDWRDDEDQDKEDELDPSSTSIPVFDPDLGMWVFKENSDASPPEDEGDQQLPADTDEGASLPSAPSAFKEPLPEISTLRRPIQPEVPRPGKRKRRPPQRRTSEQRPDSDEEEEPDHRLPRHKPQPPVAEEKKDWMIKEKIYQCDLCERTFSDRCNLQELLFTCPQCGGSLNYVPDKAPDTSADSAQRQSPSDPGSGDGFTQPAQGPVG